MNTSSTFSLSGYVLGFVSGLVVTFAPALSVWDGDVAALLPVMAVGLALAHAGGVMGSR